VRDVGYVEHDEAVVQSARRTTPLLLDNPTAKAGRNVERVARRICSGEAFATDVEADEADDSLYALLRVTRTASDEEIRRATKRQRELYGPESLAAVALLDAATLTHERTRIDEAAETLLDPMRRRAYDAKHFPEDEASRASAPSNRTPRPDTAIVTEMLAEIGPDTAVTGALLRKVREACGIDLAEISAKTKVSRVHLQALEDEDFAKLPPAVYVRGFVIEFAKALRLDPIHAERSYMARLRERAHP
jgi:flagellar biosynthesis protein FlhG